MRQLFADFSFWRTMRLTGMVGATSDQMLRDRRLYRADLWALREKFWSGLSTWPEHRKAVRALRKRRKRSSEPRKFTHAIIRRSPATRRISAADDSRRAKRASCRSPASLPGYRT